MKKTLLLLLSSLFALSFQTQALPIQKVSFAMEATYPPFESIDATGQIKGFDVDIAKAICAHSKLECTFTNQPWDSLIPSLKIGKFDALISAMMITEARKRQVDFTQPYYEASASFLAAKASNLSLNEQSLKGKVVGVQNGTTFEEYIQDKYGNVVKIKAYATLQNAFLDLAAGRVDLVFGDAPVILDWMKQQPVDKYTLLEKPFTDTKYFGEGYAIAVRKGNSELLNVLNDGLKAIKSDGTYQKIVQQYFGINQ